MRRTLLWSIPVALGLACGDSTPSDLFAPTNVTSATSGGMGGQVGTGTSTGGTGTGGSATGSATTGGGAGSNSGGSGGLSGAGVTSSGASTTGSSTTGGMGGEGGGMTSTGAGGAFTGAGGSGPDAGLGGGDGHGGSAGSGQGGVADSGQGGSGRDGGAESGMGGGIVGLRDAAPPEAGRTHSIDCGATTCSVPAQYCCVQNGRASRCVATGSGDCPSAGGNKVRCDDPTDCAAGDVCCAFDDAQGDSTAECRVASNCTNQKKAQFLCDSQNPATCFGGAANACRADQQSTIEGFPYCH